MSPSITHLLVVIPAHDEEERIGACLASIEVTADAVATAHPRVTVLTVVVLDSCSDDTGVIATRAGARTVSLDAHAVGAARRAGVAAAGALVPGVDPASVLVVNTDADCVVPRSWLLDLVRLADGHDLVLGEVLPEPDEMSPEALRVWWQRHPVGRGSLHGANLAVRLDAYRRAGGFPEVSDREDAALVRALRGNGARVVGGTRVVTSARRDGRVPAGFAGYLRALDLELSSSDTTTDPT